MKARFVVLGAGFGGLELATLLSEALGSDAGITLIDENDAFVFGYSKLDVMFGKAAPEEVGLPYADVVKPGVRFLRETITAIGRGLPGARREIDARDKFVLPGGVDSHAHIEQLSAAGIVNADTFESAKSICQTFGERTSPRPASPNLKRLPLASAGGDRNAAGLTQLSGP